MKNITKFTLIILALVFATSCEDWLEKEPVTSLNYSISLGDFDGLNLSTVGTYVELYATGYYGAAFPINSDVRCNNAKSSPKNSGRYQNAYNWIQDPSNTVNLFTDGYQIATYASQVIDAIEGYELEAGVEQGMVDYLEGEARFLRALAHYDLVRLYGDAYNADPAAAGVPIVTTMDNSQSEDILERKTVGEVYNFVVSELQAAEDLFAFDMKGSTWREAAVSTRAIADEWAVKALLARVYLDMSDYANASAYATEVIESGEFTLYDTDNYLDVWSVDDGTATETIFEVFGNFTQSNAPYWAEIGYLYDGNNSYGDVCASDELRDLFEGSDIRGQLFYTPLDDDDNELYPGYYWPLKYPGKDGDTRQNNIAILRLSEMYLIRAEAALNTGGDPLADLNAIRLNRGASTLGGATIDEIFDERRREHCFEGHIFFDYKRLQRDLVRPDEDNRISGEKDVPATSYLWNLAIPITEMEANPFMVQNDGY